MTGACEGDVAVDALVQRETDGGPVVVEVSESGPGFQGVARAYGIINAAESHLEGALVNIGNSAESALRIFPTGALKLDSVDIELGVKLNATAGAVTSKTTAEAHLIVWLHWDPHYLGA